MRTTDMTRGWAGPDQLDRQQHDLWVEAVVTVDEIANSTDSESASKGPLTALQRLVRSQPVTVVEEMSRHT